jgi:hypothetical protein
MTRPRASDHFAAHKFPPSFLYLAIAFFAGFVSQSFPVRLRAVLSGR